jgi:hypothetical protein
MRFNARLGTSHHGPPHPFKDVGVVSDSLTGVHNAMVKCLSVVNRSCIRKGFGSPHGQISTVFKFGDRGGHAVGFLLRVHRS